MNIEKILMIVFLFFFHFFSGILNEFHVAPLTASNFETPERLNLRYFQMEPSE